MPETRSCTFRRDVHFGGADVTSRRVCLLRPRNHLGCLPKGVGWESSSEARCGASLFVPSRNPESATVSASGDSAPRRNYGMNRLTDPSQIHALPGGNMVGVIGQRGWTAHVSRGTSALLERVTNVREHTLPDTASEPNAVERGYTPLNPVTP